MLTYFGHTARRDHGDCLEKVIMQGWVEGSRNPERPRATWIDQVKSLARSNSLQDLYSLVKDHQKWRALVDVTSCQSSQDWTNHNKEYKFVPDWYLGADPLLPHLLDLLLLNLLNTEVADIQTVVVVGTEGFVELANSEMTKIMKWNILGNFKSAPKLNGRKVCRQDLHLSYMIGRPLESRQTEAYLCTIYKETHQLVPSNKQKFSESFWTSSWD